MRTLSVFSVAVFAAIFSSTQACPAECNCFGFNGEWIADCARKELTSVTFNDFDSGTTEIHLQYNFLESLDEATFATVPNLKIASLPEKIFDNLVNLETLRLNGNKISDIGSMRFSNLKKLKLLYIHNNDLREVQEQAFNGLEAIEQISVATNPNLESINREAFVSLSTLKMIDMSGSALKTLDPYTVSGTLPNRLSLDKVYTYDIDTLICDQNLQEYLQWMNRNPLVAFGRATMVCGAPENLKGRSVTVVDPKRHYTKAGDCPTNCTCFNSGASYIADCSSRGFTSVPIGFAPETTEIFLQNNKIPSLGSYNFLHLSKLEFLYLHDNWINFVDLAAFAGATSLKQLTLNNNNITNIVDVFRNLVSLQVLNLNGNAITSIRPNTFASMPNLVQLSANNNGIRTIFPGAFDSLVSLKYFGMAGNRLEQLPDGVLANSANLYFVDISANSFRELPAVPSSVSIFEARNCDILSLNASSFQNADNLQTLELSNNRIYKIMEGTFFGAQNLRTINLDHNSMDSIDDDDFASARSLVTLDLSNNEKLTHLSDNAFANQRSTLQRLYLASCSMRTTNGKAIAPLQHPNLYITLSDNPWNCDCELESFSDVMRSSQASFDDPVCQDPESEKGNAITEVDYLSACSDVIIPPDAEPVDDDQTALIISLTIVLAVLLFVVVMAIVLRGSKTSKMSGSGRSTPLGSKPTFVNSEYEPDDKPSTVL